ncbi:MAG: glycosyl transferase family 28 [Phycisphaerae bacterium]|nr:glycosyl transferase family 28 [Phycisphaerae bacterium]
MIFLTVGTQLGFDRLVKAVDNVALGFLPDTQIFAQISTTNYKPKNFEFVPNLDKHQFDEHFQNASAVISHAGMGTILLAMQNRKPLLVMPRLSRFGEAVNDHQFEIAKELEQTGYLLAAYDEHQLIEKIKLLKTFVPKPRKNSPQLVKNRILTFLSNIQ